MDRSNKVRLHFHHIISYLISIEYIMNVFQIKDRHITISNETNLDQVDS